MLANNRKKRDIEKQILGYVAKLENERLWLLPGEVLVGEVTILRRLEVYGLGQVQLLNDDTGPHVEILLDDGNKLLAGLLTSTIVLNEYGQGLSNTNGIRQLDETPAAEPGGDQ